MRKRSHLLLFIALILLWVAILLLPSYVFGETGHQVYLPAIFIPQPTSTATPIPTLPPTPTPQAGPSLAGCPIFPADHIWNTRVDSLPVDRQSAAYITSIGSAVHFHADFGSGMWNGAPIGIPYVVVPGSQPGKSVTFDYANESDPGPGGKYPIPNAPPIEGGPNSTGDRHILMLEKDSCTLYELYSAFPQPDGSWTAGSGAIYDLEGYALRPAGWTSADAAGLAILPGLVRYDEILSGKIQHAIRFTVQHTRKGAYVWPARHYAAYDTNPNLPMMGQRFRLKANFNISGFSPTNQIILQAMKTYGLILADNGSNWYISGIPDERWNNDDLRKIQGQLTGQWIEAVDSASLMLSPNSGQAHQP